MTPSISPEPLKGKRFKDNSGHEPAKYWFKEDDIHSAVECLKQKVEKGKPSEVRGFREEDAHTRYYDLTMEQTLEAIDQAFEDVVKKVKKKV